MKNNYLFLTNSLPPYLIGILIGGGVVLLGIIISLIIIFSRKNKKPKVDNSKWIEALGGKENLISVSATGSRITLNLKDKEKIDREKLTEYGVKSVITMSNKVTLVKEKAEETAQAINQALNN